MKKFPVYLIIVISVSYVLLPNGFSENRHTELVPVPDYSRNDSPDITFSEDGTLWLAWSSYQQGRYHLAVCYRKDGKWSSIEYLDSSKTDQINPHWTKGSVQYPSLVYTTYNGEIWRVQKIIRNKKGWEKPQELGRGMNPTSAYSDDCFWTVYEKDSKLILTEQKNKQSLPETRIYDPKENFDHYSSPQLSIGPKGGVWLVWTASRLNYQSVLLKKLDEENNPILTVDDGMGVNRNPKISLDSQGRAWIVYEALRKVEYQDYQNIPQNNQPVYELDKVYTVENPSLIVKVTDGQKWWTPTKPDDPALGLVPNVLCSQKGTVWLVSRSFVGFSRPYRYFCPLCESLNSKGWKNHGAFWSEGNCYKKSLSLAESPDGTIWTAWAQHDREKKGFQETPSWSHLDSPDKMIVARMPGLENNGRPLLIPIEKKEHTAPSQIKPPQFQTYYKDQLFQVYFGDLHVHSEFSGCGRLNSEISQSQHYTRFIRGLDFMSTIDHAEHLNDHNWHVTQLTSNKFNAPGKFVTFTGFEWTSEFDAGGNLYRGHYNTIFRDVGIGDYYFSASDPRYNTPLELWGALRDAVEGPKNVLTFPHHPSRRMAWLSWNYYDPDMVPLIEIVQSRGSFEYEGCFSDQVKSNDCTRVRGHYIHDGLERGMRWGFVGSGDHEGCQLVAVFSPKLERNAIFKNLRARRTYATNGKRMYLDIRINGHFMGEEFQINREDRKIVFAVTGTTPLVQIDLFRNGRSIRQWVSTQNKFEHKYVDKEPLYNRENYYYLRAIQKDGGQAWSSPIWVINSQIPGEFRFQIGGDELRVVYPEQETDFSILMHNETEKTVKGKVVLKVPDKWSVKEENGIMTECPPGAWRHAVFHVTPSKQALAELCLPDIKACFISPDRQTVESSLFVVGSPHFVSREQKAVLIDARTEIPESQFESYLRRMVDVWEKDQ